MCGLKPFVDVKVIVFPVTVYPGANSEYDPANPVSLVYTTKLVNVALAASYAKSVLNVVVTESPITAGFDIRNRCAPA